MFNWFNRVVDDYSVEDVDESIIDKIRLELFITVFLNCLLTIGL